MYNTTKHTVAVFHKKGYTLVVDKIGDRYYMTGYSLSGHATESPTCELSMEDVVSYWA